MELHKTIPQLQFVYNLINSLDFPYRIDVQSTHQLIQQRFNKIELEKAKEKKFTLRNRKKGKNTRRINVAYAMKLIKKFKALLIRESVFIKHLRNPIQDYPYLLLQEKENI